MRTSHRILREAQRAMDEATSWSSWSDAASAHDQLTGMDAWRADDACEAYDATLLREDLNRLRALREAGDLLGLGDHMHDSLTRHHADLADPALFHAAWGGTKRLVEDYLDEVVRDLTFLADHPVPEPLAADRVRRFSLAARNYGRSCLMLSGGGTLGWIHLGVTKALFENGLLPGVITGASMGAMIAAGICARTDAELVDLFANPGQIRTYGLKPVGIGATARSGALLDPAVLLDTIRHNCGSYTFEESFARTGRALSISVSPTRRGQRPRLLNHLTAPHVMIPESALASSAIPGAFPPSALVAKGGDGVQRSYLGTERWIDGMLLGVSLRGRPCFPVGSDLLVRVDDDAAFYPDVQVRCPDRGSVVVVEVLSESTEAWDRGGKFERYRRLKALEHYVLIAQDHEFVEHYRRNGDGTWTYTPLRPGDVLRMDGIADLAVDDVYGRARTLPAS